MYENYVVTQQSITAWEIAIAIAILLVSLFLVGVAIRAVGIAFLSRKDERMKLVVKKSMAQAFCILIGLQTIQVLLKLIMRETYQIWWHNFTVGIYIEPVMLSLMILGVTLLINERRYS